MWFIYGNTIRKDTPAQEGKQAGVLIGRSGLLENIKLPLSTQNSWLQDYHNPQLSNDFNKPSGLKINWTGNCFFKLPIQEFCSVWIESANFACTCITSEREIVSALNVQKHINTMYNYIPIIELDCCTCRNAHVHV